MQCAKCSAELAPGAAFCPACGAPVAATPLPTPISGSCPKCGSPVPSGAGFCPVCGTPSLVAGPAPGYQTPAQPSTNPPPGYQAPPGYQSPPGYGQPGPYGPAGPQKPLPEILDDFGKSVTREPTGLLGLVVVFFTCAAVSLVLWTPLMIPSMIIRMFTRIMNFNCVGRAPQSIDMYFCSALVGASVMIGPVILMILVIILRPQINKGVKAIAPKIPEGVRFMVAPLIGTMIFELAWTGSHIDTYFQSGVLPQLVFPAVVGVFAYVVDRFGPAFQRSLVSFFDFRDQFPPWLRLVGAILVPIFISFIITFEQRVSMEAFKEQFVVLISLCVGYLAMAPRSGDLLSEARRMVQNTGIANQGRPRW